MQIETVEEFLARGGKIKRIFPRDDRFAKHNSRFHYLETISLRTIDNAFRCNKTVGQKDRVSRPPFTSRYGNFRGKNLRGLGKGNHKGTSGKS